MEAVFLFLTRIDLQDLIARTINSCLKRNQGLQTPSAEIDRWFNLNELYEYRPDKPAKATVYSEVHRRIIPVHKRGKKLMFLESEIDAWIRDSRKKNGSKD